MLSISKDKIASMIFKSNLVDLNLNVKSLFFTDVLTIENKIISEYHPNFLSVFLYNPATSHINLFEKAGFEFIQFRLMLEKKVENAAINVYPFKFILLNDRSQLNELISLCNNICFDDRFSIDPCIDLELAIKRNQYFLKESFKKKGEYIYLLIDQIRNEILGFRSYKIYNKFTAKILLSGIIKSDKVFNYSKIMNYIEPIELSKINIRKIEIIVSTDNFNELNQFVSELSYKVVGSNVILRKIYSMNFQN